MIAANARGVWRRKDLGGCQNLAYRTREHSWVLDHLQPTVSAKRPPNGPPAVLPIVAAILTKLRHIATSRKGTLSK